MPIGSNLEAEIVPVLIFVNLFYSFCGAVCNCKFLALAHSVVLLLAGLPGATTSPTPP